MLTAKTTVSSILCLLMICNKETTQPTSTQVTTTEVTTTEVTTTEVTTTEVAPTERTIYNRNYTHHVVLDNNDIYHLYWIPPEDRGSDSEIIFKVEVRAKGYFGLGFSPNGGMPGSDIVTGWIRDGKIYFQDRHATAFSLPPKDDQQDYDLIYAYENDTFTVFEFSRKLDTCDEDDWVIDESTIRMIYAYSENDPTNDNPFYHGENRGSKSVLLLGTKVDSDSDQDLTSLLQWDVMSPEVNFSKIDTLYWCTVFKSPQVDKKHHITRIQHRIQEGHEKNIHHFALYECIGGTADDYEIYLNDGGRECFTPDMPQELLRCQGIYAIWGVGGNELIFPEKAGLPIDPGPSKYYMLEAHYDNPRLLDEELDSSGLRLYYTPNLRKYDIGMLVVGAAVSRRLFIPPGQEKYIVVGHGNPECAARLFPDDGAKALGIFLHAHLIARGIRVRHFRDNKELPPLIMDDYYDFNYQAYRFFPEEISILPTDQITVEGTYDSSERSKVTHGGLSTREEMCEIALLYYPRVERAIAYSVPTKDNLSKIFNMTIEKDEDFDLTNFDWNSVDIDEVQNITRYGEHETQCYYQGPFEEENNPIISYPSDLIPYVRPSNCN